MLGGRVSSSSNNNTVADSQLELSEASDCVAQRHNELKLFPYNAEVLFIALPCLVTARDGIERERGRVRRQLISICDTHNTAHGQAEAAVARHPPSQSY